jgi:CelD/BcsL family acetyltransferase involved in cellulose biosynthesis
MITRLIRDFEVFSGLEAEWNSRLAGTGPGGLFLSHEWLCSWWRHLSGEAELNVILWENPDGPGKGAAPFLRRGDRLEFMASREVSDYADILSSTGDKGSRSEPVYAYLTEREVGIRSLHLINIPAESPTLKELAEGARDFGFHANLKKSEAAPGMELPPDYGAYLAGLNRRQRHELRRKLKRNESLPHRRLVKMTKKEGLAPAVERFIELHRASGPDKRRFWDTPGMRDFFLDLTDRMAARGWLELLLLFSGDRLAAGLLSFVHSERICFYNVAFDPAFAAYSPGIFLFDQGIQGAVEGGLGYADFLRGREKYKFDLGARARIIQDLELVRLDDRE